MFRFKSAVSLLVLAMLAASHPAQARFISEDPMGFEAGINFYTYVNNDPVNANDPSGKDINCAASTCVYSVPGAFTTEPLPRPEGFSSVTGSTDYHHLYNVPVFAGSAGVNSLNRGLVNNPTPGSPRPRRYKAR